MIVTTFNQNTKIAIHLFPMLLLLGGCGEGNISLHNAKERKNEPCFESTIVPLDKHTPNGDNFLSSSHNISSASQIYDKSATSSPYPYLEWNQQIALDHSFTNQSLSVTQKQEEATDKFVSKQDTINYTNEKELYKQYIKCIRCYRDKDYKKAYEGFKELSELGYAKAQHHIGIMYENGEYVERDTAAAIKYFKRAANQGDKYAKRSLWLLKYRLKEEKDKRKRNAIKQDKDIAEYNYNLGMQFYYTEEEHKDNKKATECFTIAAKKGHDKAQYELGLLFFKGEGVQKNYKQAKKWFRKSSNQGNREAEDKLSILTLLMNLNINSSESAWKRLFVNIGASEYWHALLISPNNIDIDSDNLKSNTFYSIEMPDNIMAGIVHYMACHQLSIRSLRLKGRNIRFTPYNNQLTNLEKLSLISNNLSSLPSCINTFMGLKSLNLTDNNFKTFPACIEYLINLRELNLSYNRITELPSFLSKLINLERLDLHNNRIASIQNSICTLSHLYKLNVSNNCLKTLPSAILDNNTSLEIDLDYNPWFTLNELCSVTKPAARKIIYSKLPYSLRTLCANTILSYIQENKNNNYTDSNDSNQYMKSIAREIWKSVKRLNLCCTETTQLTNFSFLEKDLYTMLPEELWPEKLPILIQEECDRKNDPLIIFFTRINKQEIPIHLSNKMYTPSDINHTFEQYKKKNIVFFTKI